MICECGNNVGVRFNRDARRPMCCLCRTARRVVKMFREYRAALWRTRDRRNQEWIELLRDVGGES